MQDALVIAGNTLFIRNPQTNVPYSPGELTDIDKMKIDGALMGRGLHCEFGFEPVNLNIGNFYMEQEDVVLTKVTYADDTPQMMKYDANGNLTENVDGNDSTSRYTYNECYERD